jgi:hypothetical protein
MKRRTVLVDMMQTFVIMALAAPAASIAQRPTQPIRRPLPPGRPDLPLAPGRLRPQTTGGVAGSAPRPGVFKVSAVRARDNIVRLSDDAGVSADVYVDPDIFDVSALEAGDEVAVDFFVPNEGDDRLEAASLWKLETQRP